MSHLWIFIAGVYVYAMTLAFRAQTAKEYSDFLFLFALVFALSAAIIYKDHPIAKKIFEWF